MSAIRQLFGRVAAVERKARQLQNLSMLVSDLSVELDAELEELRRAAERAGLTPQPQLPLDQSPTRRGTTSTLPKPDSGTSVEIEAAYETEAEEAPE